MLQKDISNGIVKPLNTTVFPAAEIEQAFRYLGSGKHIGKVLLQMREDENDEVSLPVSGFPYTYYDPKLTYVSFLTCYFALMPILEFILDNCWRTWRDWT